MKQSWIDKFIYTFKVVSILTVCVIVLWKCSSYEDSVTESNEMEYKEECLENDALSYVQDNYTIKDVYPDFSVNNYMIDYGLTLNDVFEFEYLADWAADNIVPVIESDACGEYARQKIHDYYYYNLNLLFSDDEIKEYVRDFYFPEDVFSEEELLEWYKEYKKEAE